MLTSTGYGLAALTKTGPAQRDTRSMAEGIDMDERFVAVLVLAPAALDGYRYLHPEAGWAKWASRAAKLAMVGLVLKGR